MKEDSLEKAIEHYLQAPDTDFWGVLSNPLMRVRNFMVVYPTRRMVFHRAVDFACGLGIILAQLSDRISRGVGLDGAAPAIERARRLYQDKRNLQFRVGKLSDLYECLVEEKTDLLILSDCLTYFDRGQQREIMKQAFDAGVDYLLLEAAIIDPNCPGSREYYEESSFKTAGEIYRLLGDCGYEAIRVNASRFYAKNDIWKRTSYPRSSRITALWLRRAIDIFTAVFSFAGRFRGDAFYDPLVLKQRLMAASWLYSLPGMKRMVEPMIGFLAILGRRKNP